MEESSCFPKAVEKEECEPEEEIEKLLDELETQISNLDGCAAGFWGLISLSRERCDVMAADTSEAISSKSQCRKTAEIRIRQAHGEAEEKISDYLETSSSKSFCQKFKDSFD